MTSCKFWIEQLSYCMSSQPEVVLSWHTFIAIIIITIILQCRYFQIVGCKNKITVSYLTGSYHSLAMSHPNCHVELRQLQSLTEKGRALCYNFSQDTVQVVYLPFVVWHECYSILSLCMLSKTDILRKTAENYCVDHKYWW